MPVAYDISVKVANASDISNIWQSPFYYALLFFDNWLFCAFHIMLDVMFSYFVEQFSNCELLKSQIHLARVLQFS